MSNVMRSAAVLAALSLPFSLTACGDLTRSNATAILNGSGFTHACMAQLAFTKDGFSRAQANGVVPKRPSTMGWFGIGNIYKVADLPNGNEWRVVSSFGGMVVTRKDQQTECLPGHAEVTMIATAPNAQNDSYKLVDFVEYVDLPPELQMLRPYVYTGYRKEVTFQKTDDGWRVMPSG